MGNKNSQMNTKKMYTHSILNIKTNKSNYDINNKPLGSNHNSSSFKRFFNFDKELNDIKFFNDYKDYNSIKFLKPIGITLTSIILLTGIYLISDNYYTNKYDNLRIKIKLDKESLGNSKSKDDTDEMGLKDENTNNNISNINILTLNPTQLLKSISYYNNSLINKNNNNSEAIIKQILLILNVIKTDNQLLLASLNTIKYQLRLLFKINRKEYEKLSLMYKHPLIINNKSFIDDFYNEFNKKTELLNRIKIDCADEYITYLLIKYILLNNKEEYKKEVEMYMNSLILNEEKYKK